MPWRTYIDALCEGGNPSEMAMREILRSPDYAHATDGAVVAAWEQRTGRRRSWGYELLDRVRKMFEIERASPPTGQPEVSREASLLSPGTPDDRTDTPAEATPAASALPQNPPDERTTPPASPPDPHTIGHVAPVDPQRPVVHLPCQHPAFAARQ